MSLHLVAEEMEVDVNELEVEVMAAATTLYDDVAQTLPAWAALQLLPERSLLHHHLLEVMQPDAETVAIMAAFDAAFAAEMVQA